MLLDLLFMRSDNRGGSFAVIAFALLLVISIPVALFKGCSGSKAPEPTIEEVHAAHITQALGGPSAVLTTQVHPPIGPWTIVKPGSRYYRALVGPTQRVIWAEAYTSTGWSIVVAVVGSNRPVYRYRYYSETRMLGKTFYPTIDR